MPRINPPTDRETLLPILEAGILSTLRSFFRDKTMDTKPKNHWSRASWDPVDLYTYNPSIRAQEPETKLKTPEIWYSCPSWIPRVSEELDMILFESRSALDNGSQHSNGGGSSGYASDDHRSAVSVSQEGTSEKSVTLSRSLSRRGMAPETVKGGKITRFDDWAPLEDFPVMKPAEFSPNTISVAGYKIPRARLHRVPSRPAASEVSLAGLASHSIRIPRAHLPRKVTMNAPHKSGDSQTILLRTKRKSMKDVKKASRHILRPAPHSETRDTLLSAANVYQSLRSSLQKKFSEKRTGDLSTTQMRIISLVRTIRDMDGTPMDVILKVFRSLHRPTYVSCLEFNSIWTKRVEEPPVSDGTAKADLKKFFLLPDDDNYLAIAIGVSRTPRFYISHRSSFF